MRNSKYSRVPKFFFYNLLYKLVRSKIIFILSLTTAKAKKALPRINICRRLVNDQNSITF